MKLKLIAFSSCMLVGAGVLGTNGALGYMLFKKEEPKRQVVRDMSLSAYADENDRKEFEKLVDECFNKGLTYNTCNLIKK